MLVDSDYIKPNKNWSTSAAQLLSPIIRFYFINNSPGSFVEKKTVPRLEIITKIREWNLVKRMICGSSTRFFFGQIHMKVGNLDT